MAVGVRLVKFGFEYVGGRPIQEGTFNHDELENRDLPNQHPISSITGLEDRLNDLFNHDRLEGRDLPDQHPISAITGLEKRLKDLNVVDSVIDTYGLDLTYNKTANSLRGDVKVADFEENDLRLLDVGLFCPKYRTIDTSSVKWSQVLKGETLEQLFEKGYKFSHVAGSSSSHANVNVENKWQWNSEKKSFVQPLNATTCSSGFLSERKYDNYEHCVTLCSTDADNDDNGVVIAALQDSKGNWNTLSFVINVGGIGSYRYYVVYNHIKAGQKIIAYKTGANLPTGTVYGPNGKGHWNKNPEGIRVRVRKHGNIVECISTNWGPDAVTSKWNEKTKLTIDLNSDSVLQKFTEKVHYGYVNHSQAQSFFKDPEFTSLDISGIYELRAFVNISKAAGNALKLYSDGLYCNSTGGNTVVNQTIIQGGGGCDCSGGIDYVIDDGSDYIYEMDSGCCGGIEWQIEDDTGIIGSSSCCGNDNDVPAVSGDAPLVVIPEGSTYPIKISEKENNLLTLLKDGYYVPDLKPRISERSGNAIKPQTDGWYVSNVQDTWVSQRTDNQIVRKEDGLYVAPFAPTAVPYTESNITKMIEQIWE